MSVTDILHVEWSNNIDSSLVVHDHRNILSPYEYKSKYLLLISYSHPTGNQMKVYGYIITYRLKPPSSISILLYIQHVYFL